MKNQSLRSFWCSTPSPSPLVTFHPEDSVVLPTAVCCAGASAFPLQHFFFKDNRDEGCAREDS